MNAFSPILSRRVIFCFYELRTPLHAYFGRGHAVVPPNVIAIYRLGLAHIAYRLYEFQRIQIVFVSSRRIAHTGIILVTDVADEHRVLKGIEALLTIRNEAGI